MHVCVGGGKGGGVCGGKGRCVWGEGEVCVGRGGGVCVGEGEVCVCMHAYVYIHQITKLKLREIVFSKLTKYYTC